MRGHLKTQNVSLTADALHEAIKDYKSKKKITERGSKEPKTIS
jgi:hypothetical protein